ncbi:dihydrofolate reductase family protein [Actinokineospora sp. HUAS TT18]|uniref:dihydrofolate reductase family protein n=1 Tax=Actinokineospora sp. HUAS TT18 TaxID=3447451 RepID=UPI003F528C2C
MRKFKLQVQVSADGYMAGPNHEMDWMLFPWTEDLNAYLDEITDSSDTIVLGRKLAEGFIPTWAAGPEGETQKSIDQMNNTPKVVITNTLTESPWDNTTVVGGDLVKAITDLKSQPGADIITYGGSTLVQSLIANNLLDELHLVVNPTAIGAGLRVFPEGSYTALTLAAATQFDCGISVLRYEPKPA